MNRYAIGTEQPDGTLEIDSRDFMAANEKELIVLAVTCGMCGEVEILQYEEEGWTVPGWDYNDELKERNELN